MNSSLNKQILVTGGLGFIGSHTCVELLNNNYSVIILDNLSNSNIDVLDNIKLLTGKSNITFIKGDILDKNLLENLFITNDIGLVIHFASLKSVNESITKPLNYYSNNITGTINILQVMEKYNCNNIIFSSSATVYGTQTYPVDETSTTGVGITNPYGKTKFFIEEILKDTCKSNKNFNAIALRYFNPIGAHKSGLIGENPNNIPNNLMPYILQVAKGKLEKLNIYGKDYNTVDGTCIRDFIHIEDLARGHLLTVNKLVTNELNGFIPINLGSGKGVSVLELVTIFENVNNIKINYDFVNRREGDLDIIYSKTHKAQELLGFQCINTIEDCCRDSYNFI